MSEPDRCEQDRRMLLKRRPKPKQTAGDRWAKRIWLKYGLTPDQVAEMWALQDGRCAIGGEDLTEKKWCIDHNHKTGKNRGLLCFYCNWKVLGQIERAGAWRTLYACVYLGWAESELIPPVAGTYISAVL